MGKKLICFLTAFFVALPLVIPADAQTFNRLRIEQVSAVLPRVSAYVYLLDADDIPVSDARAAPEQVSGTLGNQALSTVSFQPFTESGAGTEYYYLLDVSRSIPAAVFASVREQLAAHLARLGEKDRMIVITFSGEIKLILDGSESQSDALKKIEALRADEEYTRLFDGIARVQTMARAAKRTETENTRKVAILVSDGQDFSFDGGSTKNEVIEQLQMDNIPVYGLGIRINDQYMSLMGEFSRKTAGEFYPIDGADAAPAFHALFTRLEQCYRLELTAPNNLIGEGTRKLILKVPYHDQTLTADCVPSLSVWTPDTQPPALRSAELQEDGRLLVHFSEAVNGADQPVNYTLQFQDAPLILQGAAYEGTLKNTCLLSPALPLTDGTYSLTAKGISDLSMEENPLVQEPLTFTVTGHPAERWYSRYLPAAVIGLVLLILLIILLILRARKKRAAEVLLPETVPDAVSVGMRQSVHIGAVPKKGIAVQFLLMEHGNLQRTVEATIEGTFVIGRSRECCDLSVSDQQVSRQHFAVISQEGAVVVQDLNSTNGVTVNGIRVRQTQVLHDGDVLEFGDTRMLVHF